MTILDRAPPEWKRPPIPVRVKLDVVIRQEGRCKATGERLGELKNTQFDHRPAIWERRFDTETQDTVPPANDPDFIEAVTVAAHDKRTNGIGGSKRITTAGSDSNRRSKGKSIRETQAQHHARMEAKASGDYVTEKPRKQWASRPFAKGRGFQKRGKA